MDLCLPPEVLESFHVKFYENERLICAGGTYGAPSNTPTGRHWMQVDFLTAGMEELSLDFDTQITPLPIGPGGPQQHQ
jgi:hypothetical protein